MEIESANIEDHKTLSEIAFKGKSYWNYEIELLEKWRQDLTITENYIQENLVYKLLLDDEIIAFYSFLRQEFPIVKLDFFFMYPHCIGKGFGKQLLHDAIKKAKDLSATAIILDADPNAEGFYKHLGFKTYNHLESSIKNRFLPQMELLLE